EAGDLFARPGGEAVREAAHRAAALVQKAGLTGEGLPRADHAHRVSCTVVRTRRLHLSDLRTHPVDLREVACDTTCEKISVDFGFHRYPTRDRVEPTSEPQDRGDFRDAHRRRCVTDADE